MRVLIKITDKYGDYVTERSYYGDIDGAIKFGRRIGRERCGNMFLLKITGNYKHTRVPLVTQFKMPGKSRYTSIRNDKMISLVEEYQRNR